MVVILVLSVAVSVRRKNIKKKRALRRFLETEVSGAGDVGKWRKIWFEARDVNVCRRLGHVRDTKSMWVTNSAKTSSFSPYSIKSHYII